MRYPARWGAIHVMTDRGFLRSTSIFDRSGILENPRLGGRTYCIEFKHMILNIKSLVDLGCGSHQ